MYPEQIAGLWPHMGPGLDETYRRWQKYVEWVPNDFFNAVKKDRARVAFMYDKGRRIGFLVYRYFWEEFSNKKYLHIWMAYLYPEYRFKLKEYLPQGMEYLENTAKKQDCKYIELDSLRKGWGLLMPDMKKQRVVYRKEL
jgi:ribosomal protein S18 acetylase RimI-like enzyme